jgi:serine/threonine protein kinase
MRIKKLFSMYEPIPLHRLVKRIDPTLAFVKVFCGASTRVCLVESKQGSQKYILKIVDKRAHPFEPEYMRSGLINHILQEERILSALADSQGITHLIGSYNHESYVAILKEFQEGLPIDKAAGLSDYYALKKTIEAIHAYGIARLDLRYVNIIKPNAQESPPTIIDLGQGVFSDDFSLKDFHKFERKDSASLDSMFSRHL